MPDRARERLLEQSSGSMNRESTFTSMALPSAHPAGPVGPAGHLARDAARRPRPAQPNIGVSNMRKDDQAAPAARWHHRGMNATTDAFARFVDVLAEALDSHDPPAALAARAHLSRY